MASDNPFSSYVVPVVVLGVAVGSGRRLVVGLAINSRLQILNQDPEEERTKYMNLKCRLSLLFFIFVSRPTRARCHSAAGRCTPYPGTWQAHGCPRRCRR